MIFSEKTRPIVKLIQNRFIILNIKCIKMYSNLNNEKTKIVILYLGNEPNINEKSYNS